MLLNLKLKREIVKQRIQLRFTQPFLKVMHSKLFENKTCG